jgi:CheY-like chemotaxis protein
MATGFVDALPVARLATVVASPNSVFRKRILQQLAQGNLHTEEVCGGAEALARVEEGMCRSIVLDRSIGDLDVDELVGLIRARHPKVEIHVLKSLPDEDLAAEDGGTASGPGSLFGSVCESRQAAIPQEFLSSLPAAFSGPPTLREEVEPLPGMIGQSASMRRVYRMARLVAPRQTTALLRAAGNIAETRTHFVTFLRSGWKPRRALFEW